MATPDPEEVVMRKPMPLVQFDNDVVNINVGGGYGLAMARTFTVHHRLITSSSGLFDREFSREPRQPNMDLLTVKQDVFNFYLNCLYKGPVLEIEDGMDQDNNFLELTELYRLEHNLEDFKFKNAVIDAFMVTWKMDTTRLPGLDSIKAIFRPPTIDSGLARLMVHLYSMVATPQKLSMMKNRVTGTFFQRLAEALCGARGLPLQDPWSLSSSQFHDARPNDLSDGPQTREKRGRSASMSGDSDLCDPDELFMRGGLAAPS